MEWTVELARGKMDSVFHKHPDRASAMHRAIAQAELHSCEYIVDTPTRYILVDASDFYADKAIEG